MKVIANTTVISNFASVRQLELLHNLLVDVYISTEVYGEIQDGVTEGIEHYQGIEEDIYPFSLDGWLHLTSLQGDDELRLFNSLPAALHRGESSCLAIASARGWAFITDDSRARKAARSLGIPISGTLGLLIEAVKADLLSVSEADNLLHEMILLGYRSPHSTVSELM
ncbi:MAG: hypothetical protein ACOYL7_17355 [Caldilinea sp.]|jgi:predicted nucleic acid-binding protein